MARDFILFGFDHLITLTLIFISSSIALFLGLKYKFASRPFQLFLSLSLLAVVLSFNAFHIVNNSFDFGRHLPFHLCTISAYLAIFLGFIPNKRLFWVLYFWGTIAALITLILPDMGRSEGIGSFRFFEMMASHGLILIIVSHFLGVYYHSLKIKYFIGTIGLLLAFAILTGFILNPIFNGNYLYLVNKPAGGQMDFLPAQNPAHAISLVLFVSGVLTIQFLFSYLIIYKLIPRFKAKNLVNSQ